MAQVSWEQLITYIAVHRVPWGWVLKYKQVCAPAVVVVQPVDLLLQLVEASDIVHFQVGATNVHALLRQLLKLQPSNHADRGQQAEHTCSQYDACYGAKYVRRHHCCGKLRMGGQAGGRAAGIAGGWTGG